MNLLDIYKAKKLGISTGSLFATSLAKRLTASYETITEKFPYSVRQTADGANVVPKCNDTIVGGSLVWNQLVGDSDASVTVPSGHIYYANIGSTKSIGTSNGTAISVNGETDNVIDITLLFGTAIANYIKTLETNHAGDGVAYFCKLFPEDHYSKASSLESVNASAHINRDANNNILGSYELDESLTLRGISKLDANNKLYYDGDTYESDGTVTRKYGIITFDGSESWSWSSGSSRPNIQINDIKLFGDAISNMYPFNPSSTAQEKTFTTNGGYGDKIWIRDTTNAPDLASWKTYLESHPLTVIYELAASTTESAEPFINPQIVTSYGTEEYVDYSVEQGIRDVSIPVGHNTEYKKYT